MTDGCNSWRGHSWARWSKQERYDATETHFGYRQRRQCKRCGMDQVYIVSQLVSPDPTRAQFESECG